MDSSTFPQQAGELLNPSGSETPSGSTACSRAGHHSTDTREQGRVAEMTEDLSRPSSAGTRRHHQPLQIVTDLRRGAPGDPSQASIAKRTPEQVMASKQRNQFYGEVFSYREPAANARERVGQDSVVTAEVKTNVIVKDEYTFLIALSSFLSQRYNRPESSILISLNHSTCLLLGGSFEPAYLMTIKAIPSLVAPTMNKRNAALVQAHMSEELRVSPDRGVVQFQAIDEACLATNGMTALADIESRSKGVTSSRNYPPVPESPRSTHTEQSTARSFFSKKASKRSLPDQSKGKSTPERSPTHQQPEKQELFRKDAHGRDPSRASAHSGHQPGSGGVIEGPDEPGQRRKSGPTKSKGSLRGALSSRKTSVETSEEKRSHSTAPTSIDDEQARIMSAKATMPKEQPKTSGDHEAEAVRKMGKRRSFRTMFAKS